MAINIFEGARRSAKLVAAIWTIGCIAIAYSDFRCIPKPNGISCGDPNAGAGWLISGLLFLWAFTWVTGWIVRGFMDIPKGRDHREKRADTPPSS